MVVKQEVDDAAAKQADGEAAWSEGRWRSERWTKERVKRQLLRQRRQRWCGRCGWWAVEVVEVGVHARARLHRFS
jgi:hypothetical protein